MSFINQSSNFNLPISFFINILLNSKIVLIIVSLSKFVFFQFKIGLGISKKSLSLSKLILLFMFGACSQADLIVASQIRLRPSNLANFFPIFGAWQSKSFTNFVVLFSLKFIQFHN